MSEVGLDEGDVVVEVKDYSINNADYTQENQDFFTPPTTLSSKYTNHKLIILYVIGLFLAFVLLLAVMYLLKLNYKSWLPKRKHFCDFRDCFRQSNGKKRKFFQRNAKKANFSIPIVVVSDENGRNYDPEAVDSEEPETGGGAFP